MAATRNRVRLKRYIEAYAHDPRLAWSKQLAQQINLTVKSLVETIGEASAGALLRVIDGTRSPARRLAPKPFLRVSGNVQVTQSQSEVRLHFPEPTPDITGATGLDGVDASFASQVVTVRASRDAIAASISTTQNPLNPTDWNTCDHLLLTLTASSTIQALGTLDASGTRLKRVTNVSTSAFTATFQHSTSLRCPAGVNFSLTPGSSVWVYNENGTTEWRVLSVYVAPGITDHGLLTGLSDDDHTQYILANGTRAFTGNQSMGGNDLTNWDQLVAQSSASLINMNSGAITLVSEIAMTSGGLLSMNSGDITGVDDITAAGSGSTWSLQGGLLSGGGGVAGNFGLIALSDASSVFDANGGNIRELHSIDFESSPLLGSPSAGYDRMGVRAGVPAFLVGTETHCWDVPIRSQTGATITSAVTYDTTLTSILGQNFGQGSFMITSEYLLVPDTESENNIAYGERREWWLWRHDGTNDWTFTLIGESQAWNIAGQDMGPWIVNPSMTNDSNLRFTVNPWTHGATYAWRVLISAVAR